MTRDIDRYESSYLSDYGFESFMVAFRRRTLIERLMLHLPKTIVEIGCGAELLYKHYLEENDPVDYWIVVEPGREFARAARESGLPNLHVIEAIFEDATEQVQSLMRNPPQMIICSGLLHEVPDPKLLLAKIDRCMAESTILHVNVPNSSSFHRRLAKSMGLIQNLTDLSDRNKKLMQNRVYDQETLDYELGIAGFDVKESGGYFVKPFTHGQMEYITKEFGQPMLDGLNQMGKEFPELASEIFVEAQKTKK